ncbi:glycoside hydrolase family 2 TIM barrel-domain containing protein [uncultured Winogradskyella sp.]|uniref:glycoside hydrolase family 2 TIM barrel-domain containing protein n=1 Tax=uncultured Winogradskyella sp. TaxID=395353 RepID=UPI0026081CFA|nr:glycoside hydrolase family 2 TIM barrel-domain containing protein [uncultured Winogradskyella sp.]
MPHSINNIKSLCLFLGVVFTCLSFSQSITINSGWHYSENNTEWQTVNIPHTWNQLDAFDDTSGYRRGLGYYKKQIFISSTEKEEVHYLKFNAVNQEATVFLNGKKVGSHRGGYTAFVFNISEYIKYNTVNLIEVTVDNSHNEDIPPLDADFTFYGGIYRDVELIALPKQHFSLDDFASDGFYINYPQVSEENATVEVTGLLNNLSKKKEKVVVQFTLFDAEGSIVNTHSEKLKLKSQSNNKFVVTLPVVNTPKLWSPDNPYLYKLQMSLQDSEGVTLDSKSSNIGFRWASVDPKKGFFLNGKPIKLIGVNRHQDYENYGNAVPLSLQKEDINIIKEMGSNVIRFAHYPHARELYDKCDELGIIVWTEIPIVNKVTNSESFFATSINMQKEHIKQYYNYPSVIMMGYMNEIFLGLAFDKKESEEEKEARKIFTYDLAKQLEDLTRKEAPNHITVMALHFNELYNETKIADLSMLVGWNLYFGWYHDKIKDLGVFLDDQHQRFPNRSLLVSEYGPGADVRVSATHPSRYDYSQEYQLLLHSGYVNQVTEREFVSGMTAWNFADFGSEFRGETKPHINQKGLVQYNREPKEIYHWYQSVLKTETPSVHVANYLKDITLVDTDAHEIVVFSNQEKGQLYVNDNYIKDINFETGIAKATVSFNEGINTVKVETKNASHSTDFNAKIIKSLESNTVDKLAINVGTHISFRDEVLGTTFISDRSYSQNLFGYVTDSGKCKRKLIPFNVSNTINDAVYQTVLLDCNTYKVDLADGSYKVTLYFVEPELKNKTKVLFNLTTDTDNSEADLMHRIFDIKLNDKKIANQFNMAKEYADKYGIEHSAKVNIANNEGLTISLNPIKGETVMSGILIEKID